MTGTNRTVDAVIFDMDGLLLDTEPIYTEATQEVVGRFGKTFEWSLKARMIGRPAAESARILVDALELPLSPEAYLAERQSIMVRLFPDAPALPGARELVEHLAAHEVPMALATSSQRAHYVLKSSGHKDWFRHFRVTVTGDDPEVGRGKPAPDIFLAAARGLGVVPERCLVFEDAPSGMEAARAAGMAVIVVPDPAMDPAAYPDADAILSSLDALRLPEWGLPAR